MWKRNRISRIEQLPLFADCTPRELARIEKLMTAQKIPAGTVLCHEGLPGRECFIIESGVAQVSIDGQSRATLMRGSVIGEMALLDGGSRSATVVAETDMWVYTMDAAAFATMLEGFPIVARRIMKEMSERLRHVVAVAEN